MKNKLQQDTRRTVLNFVTGGVALALLFVWWVYPEIPSASYSLAGLLVILLGVLFWLNQKALQEAIRTRSLRYGTNAAITVALVVAILITLSFLNYNHFFRKDFTQNKSQSLSDQTVKILKTLKQPVRFTVFVKTIEREPARGVMDNYQYYAGKNMSVEYVDPDRDPTRAKAANVKKYGTVIITSGKRDTRVEELTEEKLTNGLIKVLKDKQVTVCFMSGHGEKGFDANDPESYAQAKTELASQNYESKQFNLLEEGKVPDDCSVLLVLGSTKAFFDKELAVLRSWLSSGGRAVFALDPNLKSSEDSHKDLTNLLGEWFIGVDHNLVLDPTSRLLGVNASVPIIGQYNKDNAITKEFEVTTLFPLASSLQLKPNPPSSIKTWWLAKSTPQAFVKTDFKEIATGKVKFDEKKDQHGPFILLAAAEGTKTPQIPADKGKADAEKPAQKPTRLVVFSTSQVASNRYAGHGANLDLFLNSISWLADDENLISIRPKEEAASLPSLSQTEARYIQLVTMILIPGGVLLAGLAIWLRRRRL